MIAAIVYWIFTFFIGLVTSAIIYARWHYGTLETTKGLPAVVKPAFIGGSDPFFYKKIVCDEDTKNVKKYGPIFGFYEGRAPHIYIADPDLIRLICIKDFEHFHNKRIMDFGHPLINEMMDILPYDKWKVVRNYLSPQLTTGKIRSMSYQMLESINEWFKKMSKDAEKNSRFDPKRVYTALTTDVIARCAFGTKINAFDDPNSVFVQNIRKFVLEDVPVNAMFSIVLSFPFLMKIAPIFSPEATTYFGNLLSTILKSRRESSQEKVNDFVDVMNDMIDKCSSSPEYKKLGITETTVMCQALIFLLAGFETTAQTLTMLSYELAKNDEVQKKLIKEVDDYIERHDGKINHENIGELVYLAACMNETLRMHPPLIRIERVCVKDWVHEPTGLTVKQGMVIQIPVLAIHYDEKYFPEPNKFKPERFLPENKDKMNPYAFLSFGQGPHNCIGMRFAKEEIQMALASILTEFRFETTDDSKLVMAPGRTFLNNYAPFHLNLCKRN